MRIGCGTFQENRGPRLHFAHFDKNGTLPAGIAAYKHQAFEHTYDLQHTICTTQGNGSTESSQAPYIQQQN